ncbi:Glucose-repressible alcohol dehydrogenase transcriptional effector [Hondaea fermentalgiana]|uniref:Glucose-repressible alcohol dehydrogenase transcriptional effector n=1 Tax=Hondaea fermentalgiana TaxID=2315210 RepID=A0A2R5GWN2_9STRA|nr:Glucose-repressible alcohol dehydrogenase transcriptional effector [Hondaea fermentalgiana]|eukprot:GBG34739.1 Glucose-repressible alcohol dehydrogenase transcriptional effector [Hondaea fermentalgiana]
MQSPGSPVRKGAASLATGRGWLEAPTPPGAGLSADPGPGTKRKGRRASLSKGGSGATNHSRSGPRFKVLSYNVLAQRKLNGPKYGYCDGGDINWHQRKKRLLDEVLAHKPDVLCLQEVDNFDLWWQPRLAEAGYDGIYCQRGRRHKDGVATFFSRSKFQLFRSETIDFNDAGRFLGEAKPSSRLQQDNVGVIVAIQPWEDSDHPSALLVSNVQLVTPTDPDLEAVQRKQVLMLLRTVERFNADFQLPVLMCGSFNFLQQSDLYTIVTRGKFPFQLTRPGTIDERPEAKVLAHSHVRVRWKAPSSGDAAIQGYVIRRRCGGNTSRGFDDPAFFPLSAVEHDGLVWREANVSGLSAGLTYEFVVAAVSAVGQGDFSQPTPPVTTRVNAQLPPINDILKHPTVPAVELLDKPIETLDQWVDSSLWLSSEDDDETKDCRNGPCGTKTLAARAAARDAFEIDVSLTPKYEDRELNMDINPTRSQIGGTRHAGLVHTLGLQSAYGTLQGDYEPPFTLNTEQFRGCVDYIFFSDEQLIPERVLEISLKPELVSPKADPRRPQKVGDIHDHVPVRWDPQHMLTGIDYERGELSEFPNRAFAVHYEPPKLVAEVHRENGARDLVRFEFKESWAIFERRKLRSITQELHERLEVHQDAQVTGKARRALSDAVQALLDRHRAKQALERGDDLNKASTSVLQQAKAEMNSTFSQNVLRPGDPGYVYNRKVDFSLENDDDLSAASWDDDDMESQQQAEEEDEEEDEKEDERVSRNQDSDDDDDDDDEVSNASDDDF